MELKYHAVISASIAGLLYMAFKSWSLSVACMVSGVFIDLDHIIDYTLEYSFPFKVKHFFYICNTSQFNKLLLILHGWEWVIITGIFAWMTEWNPWITGTCLGFLQHLILDSLTNTTNYKSYFFLWRLNNNFDHDIAFVRKTKTE